MGFGVGRKADVPGRARKVASEVTLRNGSDGGDDDCWGCRAGLHRALLHSSGTLKPDPLPLLPCRLCHGLGPHHLAADVGDPPSQSPWGGLGPLCGRELADSLHPDPVLPPSRGGYCPGLSSSPSSAPLCTSSQLFSAPLSRMPSASRCPFSSSLSSVLGTSYSQGAASLKPKAGPWSRSRPFSELVGGRS